jgi:hypothetical protein
MVSRKGRVQISERSDIETAWLAIAPSRYIYTSRPSPLTLPRAQASFFFQQSSERRSTRSARAGWLEGWITSRRQAGTAEAAVRFWAALSEPVTNRRLERKWREVGRMGWAGAGLVGAKGPGGGSTSQGAARVAPSPSRGRDVIHRQIHRLSRLPGFLER